MSNSYPFQSPLSSSSPAKKTTKKTDSDDDNNEERRIAREGDPLLPTASSSQSAATNVAGYTTIIPSSSITTNTTTSNHHYLEQSQRLRARRTTSKSPQPIGDINHHHHRSGRGAGAAAEFFAMENNNEAPSAAAAVAAAASHDDDDDDPSSASLVQQLQQQLQHQQNQQQHLLFSHQQQPHHSLTAASMSAAATTLIPALPRVDPGESTSTSIITSSYQHAATNDFLSGGGDDDGVVNNSCNDTNITTTVVQSSLVAQQQSVSTSGTASNIISPGAGQFHHHPYHHHSHGAGAGAGAGGGYVDDSDPTREDDADHDDENANDSFMDDDRYISSASNSLSHPQQHSAYSSLPSLPDTRNTNNNAAVVAGTAASGGATTASASLASSLSHQTTLPMSASVTSSSIQQQQQQQQAQEQSGGGGYQTSSTSKQQLQLQQQQQYEQQQHQYQQQQQQYQQQQQQQLYHHGAPFPRASSPTSGGDADSRSVGSSGSQGGPPLLEIPEEIYAVRKAALKVLKPLTKTWIVIAVGCSMTVLFGMARWTRLLPGIPFWFILLPSWSAHVGLLWLHILSARALSTFIAEANDSRQRPDSRDHLNRTEYLPLLQRSLKFGLKTGLLSFFVFIFEILIFIRLSRNSISLNAAFVPLWILISGGILDGFICRTQHFLRVVCWLLSFAALVLLVLKVDYDCNAIRWRVVVSPVVAVLSIASANLIYIVYGHQIGYYRLTEAQLTAGNLYSLAALICIILVVMIGEVIPLSRPVEVETRLFVVILAPLVVCLVSMGAWVVSRDEFGRLLLYGGQAAVHPMRLRWEGKGWTSVQGKGVTVIPMFGEVSFRPLERRPRHGHGGSSDNSRQNGSNNSRGRRDNMQNNSRNNRSSPADRFVELCACCPGGGHCYPYEEEEEDVENSGGVDGGAADDIGYHPYLDPSPSRSARHAYNMLRGM